MKLVWLLAALVGGAQAQPTGKAAGDAHEANENKGWTVPTGASIGVKTCHDDIENFCKKVKPGEGRLGKCLKANAKKLSKPCREWLTHGGPGHVERAYQEIDESTGAVKPVRKP